MRWKRFGQLSAVAVAAVIVVGSGGYGITQGLLGHGWATDRVLDYVRAEPCNHPDASTAKATFTTIGQATEAIDERFGQPHFGTSEDQDPSAKRAVWLVELKGKIPVLGIRGDPSACGPEPAQTLAFYIVDLHGEVNTAYGHNDWDAETTPR